jgi:hypothetical protein
MDALGAYGSDESDSDASVKVGKPKETNDKKSQEKSGLSGLLGDYSEDDDDDNDDDDDDDKRTNQNSQPAKDDAAKAVPSVEPSRKRQRRWDSPKITSIEAIPSASVAHPFPPPPTSDNRIMIEWNKDYLTTKQSSRTGDLKNITSEGLQQLSLSSAETSWAQQLKNRHDFHNPHFFESVVEQFGIRDEMGSNLPNEEQFAEWEFDLVRCEEHARVQEQAQFQQEQDATAPSHFVQQQLE